MHLNFAPFYKQYGIRRDTQLLNPVFFPIEAMSRNSAVHYLTHDEQNLDIDTSKRFIQTFKKVVVDYTLDLAVNSASRVKTFNLANSLRPFLKANKRYRFVREAMTVNVDPETLVIQSYNYLYANHTYPKTPISVYTRWREAEITRMAGINKSAKDSSRVHYVFVNTPKILIARSFLDKFVDRPFTVSSLSIFDNKESWLLLEFWKWFNPTTKASSIFSQLDKNALPKVNFVFTSLETGRNVLVNLGYLQSWLKGNPNLTEFPNIKQHDSVTIQKMFLRFMMSVNMLEEEPTVEIPDETTPLGEDQTVDDPDTIEDPDVITDDDGDLSSYVVNDKVKSGGTKDPVSPVDFKSDKSGDASLIETDLATRLNDIDKELEELEVINKKQLQTKQIHINDDGDVVVTEEDTTIKTTEELQKDVYGLVTPQQALIAELDSQAEYGLVTAADYKKLSAIVNSYPEKQDPYGNKRTIAEAVNIALEEYDFKEDDVTFVLPEQVSDPSMAKSTLAAFDSKYVNEQMSRHVVSVVTSLQKAGVIIRNHTVEKEVNVLGGFEIHNLEIKPVDGQPSTLKFRLPIVDEDGTFLTGGNKYSMRKGRRDLPIRKISPQTVSLSSYYGKTFVEVNPKVANSSLARIFKRIEASALEENSIIKDVTPAKVFDNKFKAPYMYGALASEYKGFKVKNAEFHFDHRDRHTLLREGDKLENYEKNGEIVVGRIGNKAIITMNATSHFEIYSPSGKASAGNIFDILEMDDRTVPVDFSHVTLFSKAVPVGLLLAYYLGFRNLLTFLGVEARFIPKNTRGLVLTAGKFKVSFSDGTYIFSRSNPRNSLILGGFTEVQKLIKPYSSKDFDKKDVYFNVFQGLGLSSMYLREMDLIDKMFVDPITLDVLKAMGEPQTFRGLLVRGTELLTTYYHPDSQDHEYMRDVGYERFPGAVYKKMVAAIRQYKNKNYAGKSKVDMGHYEIQNAIAQDAAIKIVEDINPIQNLKEREIVTYVGEGGRAKEAMNRASRAYHESDMGIVSEATVDSGDVGINAFMSANPQITNTLGMIDKNKKIDPTSLLSTSSLISPGATNDDQ